jgi:EAL domain-containing protein (putative c-di-GMP-specific phosphodiesterase class I)
MDPAGTLGLGRTISSSKSFHERSVHFHPNDTALVAAIVAMAGALDLRVTAEGVETQEQLSGLMKLSVPRAQGFYLARPMPADAITRLVAESHRWNVD